MIMPQNNAVNALKIINAIVPITRFNKGEAGKIIEEVKQDGIRVIVKNNVPECIMITVEEYNALTEAAGRTIKLDTSKEAEEKRKEWLKKVRANVQPPVPPSITPEQRKAFMDSLGPINVDENAIYELRRISTI